MKSANDLWTSIRTSLPKLLLPTLGVVLGLVLCHYFPDSGECKLFSNYLAVAGWSTSSVIERTA